jgi:cytidine deaminase
MVTQELSSEEREYPPRLAQANMKRAYAPGSRLRTGAASLSSDGKNSLGCKVENASYGLSNFEPEARAIFLSANQWKETPIAELLPEGFRLQ